MITWNDYPLVETGKPGQVTIRVCPQVLSPQLRNYRDILVALPPEYGEGGSGHPVIYMQDGQNLFDPATSFAADWGLVPTLREFAGKGEAPIIVGVPNMGRRRRYEYSPFRDIIHGGGGGDRYLAFLVETVKPLVDASFRTLPGRSNTIIAGSSLGGLLSLYGLYRYADVFAAAGVQSPALWFADGAILRFVAEMAPLAVGRIHLDVGTAEGGEALLDVRTLRDLLLAAGHAEPEHLSYLEEEGADHDEAAWGRRFQAALPFLLGTRGGHSMKHQHKSWVSPALGREMHIEIFGHAGARVLVFPTTLGSCYEWRDRHMHEVLSDHLESGAIQMFCLDHVHDESWYNKAMHPGARAWRHLQYDSYLFTEALPFTEHLNPDPFVIAVGASFGAYHAACFGFRHPERVHRIIGMSGMYDVKAMTEGYSDLNVYSCNPYDFMQHEHDPGRIAAFQRQDVILAIGKDDPSHSNNVEFSGILWSKGIGNALREWDGWSHDWPYWERMIRMYIGGHD